MHSLSNGTTFNDLDDLWNKFQGQDIFYIEYLRNDMR